MDKATEIIMDRPEQIVGATQSSIVGSIDSRVCHGRMQFLKVSTGDTIYISLGGKQVDSKNYHIILTDTLPDYNCPVVIGDIRAIGTVATSKLSSFAQGGYYEDKQR